jgi:CubicO group peptidase (beta-lactamase class C family)
LLGCRQQFDTPGLDEFIADMFEADRVPGISAAVVVGERLIWSGSYGFADVHREIAMSPDTLQNIGSISKTVTATAVMQLWEEGRFDLDDDVGDFLPYRVRNPRFPDTPITFRQLLAHRSSINDGPAYGESYACGDPAVQLGVWIEQYLTPGGEYYHPNDNFHSWKPGTVNPPPRPRAYSNVGFGVLGSLVEHIVDQPFTDFCDQRIFAPLGMNETGWMLSDIDVEKHAIPHSFLPDDFEPTDAPPFEESLPAEHATQEMLKEGSYFPHCLYSFYNYPDGLARTSVREMSLFLRAYMLGGTFNNAKILAPGTIQLMLSNQHFGRGLCWSERELRTGDWIWGHGGGDPGISTYMGFRQRDQVGVLMFFNYSGPGDGQEELLERLFSAGGNEANTSSRLTR